MNILLIVILLFMTCTAYVVFRRDYLSYSFLSSAVFLIAVTVAAVYCNYWGFEMYPKTVLTIVSYLVMIFIGEAFTKTFKLRNKVTQNSYIEVEQRYRINKLVVFVFTCVNVYLIIQSFANITYLADQYAGFAGAQTNMGVVRNLQNLGVIDNGDTVFGLMSIACTAFSYICVFVFARNLKNRSENKKSTAIWKNSIYLIPMMLNIILHILSGAKINLFIDLSFSAFLALILMYGKKNQKKIKFIKALKTACIALLVFIFIMWGMTLLRSGNEYNIGDNIAFYTGSPIVALNEYLQEPTHSEYFGRETFAGVRYSLSRIGMSVQYRQVSYDEYTRLAKMSTNVYTAIRAYYCDFGYLGVLVFGLLSGLLLSLLQKVYRNNPGNGLILILYAYYMWFAIRQITSEGLFSEMLSIGRIFLILFIYIFYKLLVKRQSVDVP